MNPVQAASASAHPLYAQLPSANAPDADGRHDLKPGQKVNIPAATPGYEANHIAGPDDSWGSLAQRWSVDEKALRQANTPVQAEGAQQDTHQNTTKATESNEGVGSFFEGAVAGDFSDNQSWSATAGQVAIGFIPIVGQVADARDTIASFKKVWNGEEGGWLSLGASLVGWVPGIGDAAKAAIRGGSKAADAGLEVGQQALRHGDEAVSGAAKKTDNAADAIGSEAELRRHPTSATGEASAGGPKATDTANSARIVDAAEGVSARGGTSYTQRLAQTPVSNGSWSGNRGESVFTSTHPEVTPVMSERGVEGIRYANAYPDFSPVAHAEVTIPNMTKFRSSNFSQADAALAEIRGISPSEIREWRIKNKYTWHEVEDLQTMQLVPSVVNAKFGHVGGVGEIKAGMKK